MHLAPARPGAPEEAPTKRLRAIGFLNDIAVPMQSSEALRLLAIIFFGNFSLKKGDERSMRTFSCGAVALQSLVRL